MSIMAVLLALNMFFIETVERSPNMIFDNLIFSEYETVHGRILAVNLAHVRKRSVLENATESENDTTTEHTFQEIEKANKGILYLHCQIKVVIYPKA